MKAIRKSIREITETITRKNSGMNTETITSHSLRMNMEKTTSHSLRMDMEKTTSHSSRMNMQAATRQSFRRDMQTAARGNRQNMMTAMRKVTGKTFRRITRTTNNESDGLGVIASEYKKGSAQAVYWLRRDEG